MSIDIEKKVTLTIDGPDVQTLMNLLEEARIGMDDRGSQHTAWQNSPWDETEWWKMKRLLDRLQDAGLTT